jgi:hypothetical protein
MWCFMFNLLDVHSILICLDQFYSLSNLILILKFHKTIIAPLLGGSTTHPKQFSSYSSNWNFCYSSLGVAVVHMPVVCYCFFYLYVVRFPCVWWCCLLVCGRYINIRGSQVVYHNILKSDALRSSSQSVIIPLWSCLTLFCHLFFLCYFFFVKLLLPQYFSQFVLFVIYMFCQDSNFYC